MSTSQTRPTIDATEEMDHFVFITAPSWGHIISLVPMAVKMIEAQGSPLLTTFLTCKSMFTRLQVLVEEHVSNLDEKVKNAIRIISIENEGTPSTFKTIEADFATSYQILSEARPIRCAFTDMVFSPVKHPKAVVLDTFLYNCLLEIRRISPSTKVYAWQSGAISGIMRISGPESLGGLGDLAKKAEEESSRTGSPITDISDDMYQHYDGTLVQIPGLLPLYDYEFFPQETPGVKGLTMMLFNRHRCILNSDGLIIHSSDAYEHGTLQAVRDWLRKDRSIDVYALTFPPSSKPAKPTPEALEIHQFMDDAVRKHGQKSMIFISLGSAMWTNEPEKVWTILNTLIDEGVPFIFAHARTVVPVELLEKMKSSGLGFATPWAPQQSILNHPALGWFITHGGQNSTLEALYNGIPMIYFPIASDQPVNALIGSSIINVGYELFEIRNGKRGLKPLHRFGPNAKPIEGTTESVAREFRKVLAMARGIDGITKRENAVKLGNKFRRGWDKDGAFTKDLARLLSN